MTQDSISSPMDAPMLDGRLRLDPKALDNIRSFQLHGESDLLDQILLLFIEQVPLRLTELQAACAAGNGPVMAGLAHNLRGSAANLGAHRMETIAAWIERQTYRREGESALGALAPALLQALEKQIGELQKEFEQVKLELGRAKLGGRRP